MYKELFPCRVLGRIGKKIISGSPSFEVLSMSSKKITFSIPIYVYAHFRSYLDQFNPKVSFDIPQNPAEV